MTVAVPINLTIEKGADFFVEFNLRDEDGNYLDLTNYSVAAKMARNFYSTTTKYSLNAQKVDNLTGLISISMNDTSTSQFLVGTDELKEGRYVYNVYIESTGTYGKDKVIEGIITVVPGVL